MMILSLQWTQIIPSWKGLDFKTTRTAYASSGQFRRMINGGGMARRLTTTLMRSPPSAFRSSARTRHRESSCASIVSLTEAEAMISALPGEERTAMSFQTHIYKREILQEYFLAALLRFLKISVYYATQRLWANLLRSNPHPSRRNLHEPSFLKLVQATCYAEN